MQRFDKQVALITGGLGAMGLAIARRLAREGARVVLADRVGGDVAAVHAQVGGAHPPTLLHLEVTEPASWQAALQALLRAHGRLDVLVNNAGVVAREARTIDEVDVEDWRHVFAVNVDGTLLGIQAAMQAMRANPGGGAIVNMGSVASYVGSRDGAAYGASKAAVRNLNKQAALSAARMGLPIRVNAVHPGYVWTPLVAQRLVGQFGSLEAAQEAVRGMNPMRRIVEVDDVAAAVAFLASEAASMVTGADLVIDGGRLIQ